jgi:hypothetical protein
VTLTRGAVLWNCWANSPALTRAATPGATARPRQSPEPHPRVQRPRHGRSSN